jgi:GrpB-like predicted nucleotidyltransferase (UPF0157 family)
MLLTLFGVSQVEHIGSTSIPGLSAKPIIDVVAEIHTFEQIDEISGLLTSNDWHYVPHELDNKPWRRFLSKLKTINESLTYTLYEQVRNVGRNNFCFGTV